MNGQEKGVSELNIAGQWTERCNNRAKLERTVIGWISILRLPMAESGCWVEVWGCFVRVCARTETMQGVCVVVCRWRGGEKRGRLDFEDFHLKWAFGKVSVEERAGRTGPMDDDRKARSNTEPLPEFLLRCHRLPANCSRVRSNSHLSPSNPISRIQARRPLAALSPCVMLSEL